MRVLLGARRRLGGVRLGALGASCAGPAPHSGSRAGCAHPRVGRRSPPGGVRLTTLPRVSGSPLDAHVATPREIAERIAAERRGTPFLVYRDGSNRQAIFDLGPAGHRITIGRRPGNDVALEWDHQVSRVHAEIERLGEDWVIVDDGLSHNGTFVNAER